MALALWEFVRVSIGSILLGALLGLLSGCFTKRLTKGAHYDEVCE
eukprot:SAG11_NODE_22218_length_410_cov_0.627010_2_plen_44_part_01